MKRILKHTWIVALPLLAGLIGLTACEIDSSESVTRDVDINVSGFYDNDGAVVVSRNTGASIKSFDLRQSGDQLEAVDNNGKRFSGTIGSVNGTVASFTLTGNTTANQEATITGSISVSSTDNNSGEGVMRGTWIEPSLYGTVYAVADGISIQTNAPSPGTNTNTAANVNISISSRMVLQKYRDLYLWFMDKA